jgi:ferredoxin-NADP reductase
VKRDSTLGNEEPSEANPQIVRILMTEFETHDVKRFIVEKPKGLQFIPGQATLVAVDQDGWREKRREFSFTNTNDDSVLEFTIKKYPSHEGVTKKLHELDAGDTIIVHEPFGTIVYEGEGYMIAAGTGITPFIAISRHLKNHDRLKGNHLIFSNKTADDVILEKEFRNAFEDNLTLTLTQEERAGYEHGRIDREFLSNRIDSTKFFYLCGPDPFVLDTRDALLDLGATRDRIVAEKMIVGSQ